VTPIVARENRLEATRGMTGDPIRRESLLGVLPPWATFARDLIDRAFTRPGSPAVATRVRDTDSPGSHEPLEIATGGVQPSDLLETIRRSYATPIAPTPTLPMRVTNRWTGVVDAVRDDVFEAHFSEIGNETVQFEGDFLISSLSDDDQAALKAGMFFSAVRSKVRVNPGAQWQESTALRLRRFGRLTDKSVGQALEEGAKWAAVLEERARGGE
jgi:hypothetical protein